jgi:hypothetical protein
MEASVEEQHRGAAQNAIAQVLDRHRTYWRRPSLLYAD